MAHRKGLRDIFGSEHERRDRFEWATEIVKIKPSDDQVLPRTSQELCDFNKTIIEELAFIDTDDHRSIVNRLQKRLRIRNRYCIG